MKNGKFSDEEHRTHQKQVRTEFYDLHWERLQDDFSRNLINFLILCESAVRPGKKYNGHILSGCRDWQNFSKGLRTYTDPSQEPPEILIESMKSVEEELLRKRKELKQTSITAGEVARLLKEAPVTE